MAQRDRLGRLLANTAFNGIDFVDIASADQRTLRVHFINQVSLQGTITRARITGGETVSTVTVNTIDEATDWSSDPEGRPLLKLTVPSPGDFSGYTLSLTSSRLDPFYDHAVFSFKANCESDLDCAAPAPVCPAPAGAPPPIDYLAKDFLSFRQALSDFSAGRYLRWRERAESDFGVMFMEALCAVADELSYTQDRVASESTLDTATQRRSVVRLARLVDYEPRPAIAATVTLQLDVAGGPIPAGLVVSATGPTGETIPFETGTGLNDTTSYVVDSLWNRPDPPENAGILPYLWDDSQRCLERGATEMWVQGWGFNFLPGQALLIETAGLPGDPPVRQVVHLTPSAADDLDHAVEETDQLFATEVTHLRWSAAEAIVEDRDLNRSFVAGNLVPATQGRRFQETFAIECPTDDSDCPPPSYEGLPRAVTRTGPNSSVALPIPLHLYTLRRGRLAWILGDQLNAAPTPEIALTQLPTSAGEVALPWAWARRLLDADPYDPAFTVDPAGYREIGRDPGGSAFLDYTGDDADTIRFGDSVFGSIPDGGATFRVRFRVADGAAGNVPADAITALEPSSAAPILRVTNPFAARAGADAEPLDRVRKLAPQAFRAQQFRAVRPEDYVEAAGRLPWVQNSGAMFRWTGSWLTVFTTPDPVGRVGLPPELRTELVDLLNRYRLAGYESYVPGPRYVPVDLVVTVCARPDAFRGEVKAELLARLGTGLVQGAPAFFHPDQFTFGTPLERSRLEAAIQAAPGVAGVLSTTYRRRGLNPAFVELSELPLLVGPDEILRVDGDPNRPGMGSLRVYVEGGK